MLFISQILIGDNMIIFNTMAYNAERTIARTIESVLSQTYERFEYYIIDNGSKDNTFSIMSDYARTDNRIHLLKNNINSVEAIKHGIPISWSTHNIIELAI